MYNNVSTDVNTILCMQYQTTCSMIKRRILTWQHCYAVRLFTIEAVTWGQVYNSAHEWK